MRSGFELFEHTADVGVRAWGPTRAAVVSPCVEGLYAIIGEVVTQGSAESRVIEAVDAEPAVLLRDFLGELLHEFEVERRRATDIDVSVFEDDRLRVKVSLAAVDFEGSELEREVKAITYHELTLRPTDVGFEAKYIVDI